MMKKIIFLLIAVIHGNLCLAEVAIDINRGVYSPIPIAIHDFRSQKPETATLVQEVIKNDLSSSGLLHLVDPSAFVQKLQGAEDTPNFANWRLINTQFLLNGEIRSNGDRITVVYKLYDVLSEKTVVGASLSCSYKGVRQIAHMISDSIYTYITGEGPYFNSRIVYVVEQKHRGRIIKRLAIMDSDGANHKFLTNGADIVLTPRFSPNMQEITYFAFVDTVTPNGRIKRGVGKVFLFDLANGKHQFVGSFSGMTFAPRFSADGRRLIFSLSDRESSSIYETDLRSGHTRRITRNCGAIDTSPCYSPDGDKIVFSSDRGGTQQLYIMDADGGNIKRLSFGQGQYATPVWSPRRDWIAFTRIYKGTFYIGVMRPDGTGERMLASGYLVEGPAWFANGRGLMFSHQSYSRGKTSIHSIDVTGHNERILLTPHGASDPACSPVIQ
ncbi:MAG: Tol-Pal system beta propeller repeat protein TolB [Holosporales bacterium]|jgi:TolB protein|nr:Tol-Pal system beta propeller repeat protein TolB [Holosporales bacterium]